MSIVELVGLTKDYGTTRAVEELTVNIERGEFLTFLGPSGCGKTTSLRLVAGFIEPTAGRIVIGGRTMSDPAQRIQIPPEERNLGMVFQSYAVWPHMTVFDNIAYPLRIKHVSRRSIADRVAKMLDLVKMGELARRRPNELSGGQQQRVALARALVTTPDVLLLDEPLSNLDAKLREEMRIEIKELQRRTGVTIIFVTHDQLEAMVMSDRIVVMNRGRIRQIGSPEAIYQAPADRFVADFIGTANFIDSDLVQAAPRSGGGVRREAGNDSGRGVLVVRPEDIEISKEPRPGSEHAHASGGDRLVGTVENRLVLGDALLYLVRVDKKIIRIKTTLAETIETGDRVSLRFGRVYRLPAEGEPDPVEAAGSPTHGDSVGPEAHGETATGNDQSVETGRRST